MPRHRRHSGQYDPDLGGYVPPPLVPSDDRMGLKDWAVLIGIGIGLIVISIPVSFLFDYFGWNIIGYTISFVLAGVVILALVAVIGIFTKDK